MKRIILVTCLILGATQAVSLRESRVDIKTLSDDNGDDGKSPEEKVAKVVVEKSDDFKKAALRASREAAVSK